MESIFRLILRKLIFTSSDGKFFGNQLWVDPDFSKEKISIKAVLRSNPALYKEFDMYVKKLPNPDKLKSVDELMNEMNSSQKSSHKKRN